MRKNILSFLLGVACILFIASTSQTVSIFKPAKPVSVHVKTFTGKFIDAEISDHITKKHIDGFIVKDITLGIYSSGTLNVILIMEKY